MEVCKLEVDLAIVGRGPGVTVDCFSRCLFVFLLLRKANTVLLLLSRYTEKFLQYSRSNPQHQAQAARAQT